MSICPFVAQTWKARQVHAVSFVRGRNFDLGEFVQRVELRQTQGCEPVDHGRVPKENEIEPTAPTLPSRGHAPLSATCLQVFADLLDKDHRENGRFDERSPNVFQFSGKDTIADTRSVRLDNTVDIADVLRGETETGAHAANTAVRRGHVRIGTLERRGVECEGSFESLPKSMSSMVALAPSTRILFEPSRIAWLR